MRTLRPDAFTRLQRDVIICRTQRQRTGTVTKQDLEEVSAFLPSLAGIAAIPSLRYFRHPLPVESKGLRTFDPVTAADRETEQALRDAIRQTFPDHGIAGEEGDTENPDALYRWVIDPIDGTRAYICGVPTWATLVAFCDRGEPVFGMMSQPYVGECFIADASGAKWLRGADERALSTSDVTTLASAALFATSAEMFERSDEAARFSELSSNTKMTRYGIDSYAYCLLAAGQVDVVVESGLGFYDIAALIPIIERAGGVVTGWDGAPVTTGGRVAASANPVLHDAVLRFLG